MQSHSINLLEIIPNSKQSQKQIYSFNDFKQWFNHISPSQLTNPAINPSKLDRAQSFQFSQDHFKKIQRSDSNFTQLLINGPLNINRIRKLSNHQLGKYDFQQKSIQNTIREGSAMSSRSFNGYQQVNQYQLRQKLGKGAFSEVYQGIDVQSPDKTKYAIKIMQSKLLRKKFFRKSSALQTQTLKVQVQRSSQFVNNQIALLKKISHQHITKLYQVIINHQKGKAYLILQYCQNGFINQSPSTPTLYRKLTQLECKKYYKQLILAVYYIHQVVKIAHRDIKPENILISKHDKVKLSDFGLGTKQMETDQYSGTRLFMPPENSATQGKKVVKTQAADIWALGVTLLIMLTGAAPQYNNNEITDLPQKIQQLKQASPQLKNFLKRCLQPNVQKRITADELLIHKWICDDQLSVMIQKNIIKQFEIVISPQEERDAIKDVYVRKPIRNILSLDL